MSSQNSVFSSPLLGITSSFIRELNWLTLLASLHLEWVRLLWVSWHTCDSNPQTWGRQSHTRHSIISPLMLNIWVQHHTNPILGPAGTDQTAGLDVGPHSPALEPSGGAWWRHPTCWSWGGGSSWGYQAQLRASRGRAGRAGWPHSQLPAQQLAWLQGAELQLPHWHAPFKMDS